VNTSFDKGLQTLAAKRRVDMRRIPWLFSAFTLLCLSVTVPWPDAHLQGPQVIIEAVEALAEELPIPPHPDRGNYTTARRPVNRWRTCGSGLSRSEPRRQAAGSPYDGRCSWRVVASCSAISPASRRFSI
jgi:hypothetical protein